MLLSALLVASALAAAASGKASTDVGATVSAVFPPPAATQDPALFPSEPQVGFEGPTPTGNEAEAIQTVPALAQNTGYYPLLNPGAKDNKNTNLPRLWGNLSPWFSVPSHGLPKASPQIPDGCKLNQVHLLHRHGARYPTTGAPPSAFATKVHAAVTNGTGFTATGPLSFLNTWKYQLGAELLTPFGREQLFNLGVGFRVKYGELLTNFTQLPVWRTTSEDRMIKSALNFAAGFYGVPDFLFNYNQEIIVESDGFNNTLAPYDTCANSNLPFTNFGTNQTAKWVNIYLQPALKRIQKNVKGLNFTVADIYAMQNLCAYEEVALGYSAFCDVFTEEEWKGFEYALDLGFWYSNSFGSPVSAAMGIGWVSELVSRLTKTPITVHNTTTNGTLNNDPRTFPLDQTIYVDATHDTVISTIIVALNFTSFAAGGPLPTDHIPRDQTFIVNQISPFSSNLVGQVISCPAGNEPTHIRFILNDGVVPLTGIKGCKADKNGLCELGPFITAMRERIGEIDWAFDCLANYTVPNPAGIVDGRPPASVHPRK